MAAAAPVAPLGQVLQTSDAMLRQEVQRFPPPASSSRWLPNVVTGALLALILFWMSMSRLGFPVRCFGWREGLGLPRSGRSGPLCVVGAQGLQSGEPLCPVPWRRCTCPVSVRTFPLTAAEQVLRPAQPGRSRSMAERSFAL